MASYRSLDMKLSEDLDVVGCKCRPKFMECLRQRELSKAASALDLVKAGRM